MQKLLLVVEHVAALDQRDIVTLFPDISAKSLPKPRPSSVMLRYPDGSTNAAAIGYSDVLASEDRENPWHERCFLENTNANDIPAGTEVWCEIDER